MYMVAIALQLLFTIVSCAIYPKLVSVDFCEIITLMEIIGGNFGENNCRRHPYDFKHFPPYWQVTGMHHVLMISVTFFI